MKKGIVLMFLFLWFGSFVEAQTVDSLIANYNRPVLERKSREFTLNGLVRNFNEFYRNFDSSYEGDLFFSGGYRNSVFSNDSLTQQRIFANGSFNIGLSLDTESTNFFQASLNLKRSSVKKKFKSFENQKFNEWEINYSGKIDYKNNIQQDSAFNNFNIYDFTFRPTYYVGKGRIEIVNDAWHAITILEMLSDGGVLDLTKWTNEDKDQFAWEIGRIKNIRNTDFRLENIAEYERLFNIFLAKKLVEEGSEARFFSILIDAWSFESFYTRQSGKEYKAGLTTSARLFTPTVTSANSIRYPAFLEIGGGISLQYNIYKSKSLDWQYDQELKMDLRIGNNRILVEDPISGTGSSFLATISYAYSIGYIPNQRTNISIILSSNAFYGTFFRENTSYGQPLSISLDPSIVYNKYFSPNLVLFARGNISFYHSFLDTKYSRVGGFFQIGWNYRMW